MLDLHDTREENEETLSSGLVGVSLHYGDRLPNLFSPHVESTQNAPLHPIISPQSFTALCSIGLWDRLFLSCHPPHTCVCSGGIKLSLQNAMDLLKHSM